MKGYFYNETTEYLEWIVFLIFNRKGAKSLRKGRKELTHLPE